MVSKDLGCQGAAIAYRLYVITVENKNGVDCELLEVKVPLLCLCTAGVSARRDGRYSCSQEKDKEESQNRSHEAKIGA